MDGFEAFGRESQLEIFVEFGDENFPFLQIGKSPRLAARIVLGGAGAI